MYTRRRNYLFGFVQEVHQGSERFEIDVIDMNFLAWCRLRIAPGEHCFENSAFGNEDGFDG
jgi:hypothetical protein